MANAKAKDPTIESEATRAHAENNPLAAGVLVAFHRQWGLWRLCCKKPCRRARDCRGDELACAARRWRMVHSLLGTSPAEGMTDEAAARLLHDNMRLWSEVDRVLCKHEEHLFVGLAKGPFLRVYRNNHDGSKTLLQHRDLTDEQARKIARRMQREKKLENKH